MKGRLVVILWDGDPDCRTCGLRDAGWFVELADQDIEQTLSLIRADLPDAVVIDLAQLPAHGLEVARRLRRDPAAHRLPLVFLDGAPDGIQSARLVAPHALFTSWERLAAALGDYLHSPEED